MSSGIEYVRGSLPAQLLVASCDTGADPYPKIGLLPLCVILPGVGEKQFESS